MGRLAFSVAQSRLRGIFNPIAWRPWGVSGTPVSSPLCSSRPPTPSVDGFRSRQGHVPCRPPCGGSPGPAQGTGRGEGGALRSSTALVPRAVLGVTARCPSLGITRRGFWTSTPPPNTHTHTCTQRLVCGHEHTLSSRPC